MSRFRLNICLAVLTLCSTSFITRAQVKVEKSNPMKVYMHYMPWFETPASVGHWGWHWTMNNQNPEIMDAEGHRQIASHYYPLIGPYASRDRDVIEYHLLLMKLSGIDGVLINWYGVLGSNGDINDLLKSSNAIVGLTDDFGLQFGVVMEDRFSRSADDVEANLGYLQNNYFIKPQYIKMEADSSPLVGIFGPITFQTPSQWNTILPSAGPKIEFLTLWYESDEVGSLADGEFSWVYQDNQNHITHLTNFYKNQAPNLKTAMGSIYPGFYDFYQEGGAGDGYFTIPHYNGGTLDATIAKAQEYKSNVDMVQLVTFNDFGEGTIFEPTVETGFEYLKKIQQYTGVTFGEDELRLVYRLYLLRKDYKEDELVQTRLDSASIYLRNLKIDSASTILMDISLSYIPSQTGINEIFNCFPNPYQHGALNFAFSHVDFEPLELVFYDICGKPVLHQNLQTSTHNFSIPLINLTKGIYFPVLYSKNQVMFGNKLIVQ